MTLFCLDLLQEELRDLMKDKQVQKDILAAQQENQRLQVCLQEAEEKIVKLQEKMDGYSEAKAKKVVRGKLKTKPCQPDLLTQKKEREKTGVEVYLCHLQESRARVKFLENHLRDLKVEYELLHQAFKKVR